MDYKKQPAGTSCGSEYLECEKWLVFVLMMFTGGYFGAFTYTLRGGVFCNAQTGNFVLLAMALGNQDWAKALYLLIPITAYCLGAFVSELLPNPVKRHLPMRWDTLLIAIEMVVVLVLVSASFPPPPSDALI